MALTVKLGLLEDLDFADVHVVEWVDAVAGLLNVPGDAVWDPATDHPYQTNKSVTGIQFNFKLDWSKKRFVVFTCYFIQGMREMEKKRICCGDH